MPNHHMINHSMPFSSTRLQFTHNISFKIETSKTHDTFLFVLFCFFFCFCYEPLSNFDDVHVKRKTNLKLFDIPFAKEVSRPIELKISGHSIIWIIQNICSSNQLHSFLFI